MTTLMYHDIFSESPSESGFTSETAMDYKVGATDFEAHITALEKALGDNLSDTVAFTFDDGGASAITAARILESHGLRGTFFVSTAYIGSPGFLNAGQIRELAEKGHIIGAHSHTHRYSKEAITQEWEESVKILSDITGTPITVASAPHGLVSGKILESARQAGIKNLYSTEPTDRDKVIKGITLKGRFCIHRNDTPRIVLATATDPHRKCRLHIRWALLSIPRTVLGRKYPEIKMILRRRSHR